MQRPADGVASLGMSTDPAGQYTALLKGSLKLDRFGTWWHNGVRFSNEKLAAMFHRSIIFDAAKGEYLLQIGQQRAEFDLEDTAWFVTELHDSSEPWSVTFSDGSSEPFEPESITIGGEEQLYHPVKALHRARFTRPAHQRLLQHCHSDGEILMGGKIVRLGR